MSWTTPKTNWVSNDYFNITDYARIRNNMLAIKEIADACYWGLPQIEDMEEKAQFSDIMYAEDMNAIERNLHLLNENTVNLPIGDMAVYSANGHTPLFTEFNRVESGMNILYNTLLIQYKMLPRLPFILGGAKIKL